MAQRVDCRQVLDSTFKDRLIYFICMSYIQNCVIYFKLLKLCDAQMTGSVVTLTGDFRRDDACRTGLIVVLTGDLHRQAPGTAALRGTPGPGVGTVLEWGGGREHQDHGGHQGRQQVRPAQGCAHPACRQPL